MRDLTVKEFETVREAHQEESWWYLFLNYGCPIDNPFYEIQYNKMRDALEAYIAYMSEQQEKLGLDELSL